MAQREDTSRRNLSDTQTVSRRNDVIRCSNCGEDYATTYKRCPFCDGRTGGAATGRRAARNTRGGGYGGPVSPLQIVYVVVTLIVIIAALYIVFTKVGPLLFPKDPAGDSSSSISSSQSGTPSGSSSADVSQPGSSSGDSSSGDVSSEPTVMVEAIVLSRTDFTLNPGEPYKILAAVSPATVTEPVKWTSSDPTIATVDEDGTVTNVNTTGEKQKVIITATCGNREVTCDVYCKSNPAPSSGGSSGTSSGSGEVAGKTGTVVNAGGGLNIRSGPGSGYEKIASTSNGAKVTILEDAGNGWYKIDYGNGKVGYVSADFISVK